MSANPFDERIATSYREKWPHLFEPETVEPAVRFLAALAGRGPVLEFGIGTGRLAIPLGRLGFEVHGVELSQAMVDELRRTPGGEAVPVTVGDFSTARPEGAFRLVYLVRNTITNLTTQVAQISCFENAAALLEHGGSFVIEVGVPELRRLAPGERARVFDADAAHFGVEVYDVANQTAVCHHFWVTDAGVERFSAPFRYVWPSELDLMASMAGMRLAERWETWTRDPFTSESRAHVSVWRKPQ